MLPTSKMSTKKTKKEDLLLEKTAQSLSKRVAGVVFEKSRHQVVDKLVRLGRGHLKSRQTKVHRVVSVAVFTNYHTFEEELFQRFG